MSTARCLIRIVAIVLGCAAVLPLLPVIALMWGAWWLSPQESEGSEEEGKCAAPPQRRPSFQPRWSLHVRSLSGLPAGTDSWSGSAL